MGIPGTKNFWHGLDKKGTRTKKCSTVQPRLHIPGGGGKQLPINPNDVLTTCKAIYEVLVSGCTSYACADVACSNGTRTLKHSRPQSPRSFWSAPRIETSGRDRSRKSANHGLPALVRSLRNLNNNGYYRLQKWAAIALARDLVPARGLDPWRRPKGSWALGTRMTLKGKKLWRPKAADSVLSLRLGN